MTDSIAPSYQQSILGGIGNTPLVQINSFNDDGIAPGCKILAKLEMQNPGGSVKDRIALMMIEEAEKRGEIKPGVNTIIEATSGNTGIGIAMVCAAKGYKCILVMPQLPPMGERYMIDRMFGAEVILTRANKGVSGVLERTKQLCAENPDYWTPSQFDNVDNPKAHYENTGPEIWRQTGGNVDIFIAGAGTGGTIRGCSTYLKEQNPALKSVLIEPTESRVLVGNKPDKHALVGIGAGIPLPLIEALAPGQPWEEGSRGVIDEFMHCSTPEGIAMCKRLSAQEGLLVGPTSGAAMKVALDVAKRPESAHKVIVVIFPSSAIRYVSHPLWSDIKAEAARALPIPPNMEDGELECWNSKDAK